LLRSLKWADKWYSGILLKLGCDEVFSSAYEKLLLQASIFSISGELLEGATYKALLMWYLT
jgi:hypothetical protein